MSRPSGNNRSDSLYREYVSLLNRRTFVTGAMAVTAFSASPKFAQAQSNLATQFVTAASGNGLQLQVLSIPIYTPGSNGSPQLAYQDFKGIWHTPSNVLSTPSPLSYLLAQKCKRTLQFKSSHYHNSFPLHQFYSVKLLAVIGFLRTPVTTGPPTLQYRLPHTPPLNSKMFRRP